MLSFRDLVSGDFASLSEGAILAKIIADKLPAWKRSCDHAGADTIILDQAAFAESAEELLLMGIAIKYATGTAGKHVVVNPAASISPDRTNGRD